MELNLPLWVWIAQAAGVALSLWGATRNAQMDRRCFPIWIASNVVLISVHAYSGLWFLVVLDVCYGIINFRGMRLWRLRAQQTACVAVD